MKILGAAAISIGLLAGLSPASAKDDCDAVVSRVRELAKVGKVGEAKRYTRTLEACVVKLRKQQENQYQLAVDGYENLIRVARASDKYSGPLTFIDSCEEAVKIKLRSPSTYKRISTNELPPEPMSEEMFLSTHGNQPHAQEAFDKGGRVAVRFRAYVSYDAANAFGTPVRDTVECSYDAASSTDIPGPYSVKVDGKSGLAALFRSELKSAD